MPSAQKTEIIDALGGITKYVYNENGQQISMTDAKGNTTKNDVDVLGRQTAIHKAMNASIVMKLDEKGNVLSKTDPMGNTTHYGYNLQNQKIRMTNAMGESEYYQYDLRGKLIARIDAAGNTHTRTYDATGLLLSLSDDLGDVRSFQYDANGKLISETDGEGNTTTIIRDALGRVIEEINPKGKSSYYAYDKNSNPTEVTDENGHTTRYAYNDRNKKISVTDPMGGVIHYTWDAAGNNTSRPDPNGNYTYYSHDKLHRLVRETYADGTTVRLDLDAVGNVIAREDNDGKTKHIKYDDLYRPVFIDLPGSDDLSFTYNLNGDMVAASNDAGSVILTYDMVGRVTSETINNRTTTFIHDLAKLTRTIRYPGGKEIVEQYDARARISSIADKSKVIAEMDYNLNNALTQRSYKGNGTSTAIHHNPAGKIIRIDHNPGAFAAFEYDLDAKGNRIAAKSLHNLKRSETYSYDDNGQLLEFRRGALSGGVIPAPVDKALFQFDATGNRISSDKNGVVTSYNTNNMNEYTEVDQDIRSHDANGNLQVAAGYQYKYNSLNQLTEIVDPQGNTVASYKYGPRGRRLERQAGKKITRYYYNHLNVIEETDDQANVEAIYVQGENLDEVLYMERAGKAYYYHHNALGSVVALTDAAGQLKESYEYGAFGELSSFDGNGNPLSVSSAVGNPFFFTARRKDSPEEPLFVRSRYYDEKLGRFTTRDRAGMWFDKANKGNGYAYVANDPINLSDPTGQEPVTAVAVATVVVAGAAAILVYLASGCEKGFKRTVTIYKPCRVLVASVWEDGSPECDANGLQVWRWVDGSEECKVSQICQSNWFSPNEWVDTGERCIGGCVPD